MSISTTQFQAVTEVIGVLAMKLAIIEQQASLPETPLHGNMEVRTCSSVLLSPICHGSSVCDHILGLQSGCG